MAEVPLAEMFGYSNDLRSMTQGKGSFTMEFLKYQKLPASFQEEIVKKRSSRRRPPRPDAESTISRNRPEARPLSSERAGLSAFEAGDGVGRASSRVREGRR